MSDYICIPSILSNPLFQGAHTGLLTPKKHPIMFYPLGPGNERSIRRTEKRITQKKTRHRHKHASSVQQGGGVDQTFLSAGLDRHGSLPACGVQSADGHQILSVWLQSSEHSGVAVALHLHGAYVSAGKHCVLHPVALDVSGL